MDDSSEQIHDYVKRLGEFGEKQLEQSWERGDVAKRDKPRGPQEPAKSLDLASLLVGRQEIVQGGPSPCCFSLTPRTGSCLCVKDSKRAGGSAPLLS